MPLYEYRCGTCGKVFEVIQKMSDAPLKVHAECGGSVERLISASGFRLKGSGWYATDYAKSAPKSEGDKKAADEGKPAADAKPAGDTKPASDAKPAPATESKPTATTATKADS